MKRKQRAAWAKETVEICERGSYQSPAGKTVRLKGLIAACVKGTRVLPPEGLVKMREGVLAGAAGFPATDFEVANESTLAGARRLVLSGRFQRVAALNFASAKHPGGGFLNGSLAQEESLAVASALYPSLLVGKEYYGAHRMGSSCLYSDRMIWSPACPVFRDDEGELLEEPYAVSFITSAAPNAGAIADNSPEEGPLIPAVLARRAQLVLALAAHEGVDALVLGAWGCGVFRNDPELVAEIFAGLLEPSGPWHGRFRQVVFSVLDRSEEAGAYKAFLRFAKA